MAALTPPHCNANCNLTKKRLACNDANHLQGSVPRSKFQSLKEKFDDLLGVIPTTLHAKFWLNCSCIEGLDERPVSGYGDNSNLGLAIVETFTKLPCRSHFGPVCVPLGMAPFSCKGLLLSRSELDQCHCRLEPKNRPSYRKSGS